MENQFLSFFDRNTTTNFRKGIIDTVRALHGAAIEQLASINIRNIRP